MAIETTQSIPTTSPTSRTVRGFAIGAGLASAFLAGLLVATGTADSGVGLTRTGWDLARAGAITFGILAVLAACTYWGVEQVVHRIEEQATRNRCATLDLAHRQHQLLAELATLRGQLAGRAAVKATAFDHEVKAAVADLASFMDDQRR